MTDRYMSRKGFSTYSDCPFRYFLEYVERRKPPKPDNLSRAMFGTVLGELIEIFYRDRLWKNGSEAVSTLTRFAPSIFEKAENSYIKDTSSKWQIVDYSAYGLSRDGVLADVIGHIPIALGIIKDHRLIGSYAEAEVEMEAWAGDWRLSGKADLIFRRDGLVHIVDGKGSAHRDKYVDEDQLRFYALMFYLTHGKLPDRLGWMFYRFPGDAAVDWIRCDVASVKDLRDRLQEVLTKVEQEEFDATPGWNACKFCSYASACKAKSAWDDERRKKKPPKLISAPGGITELDF